MSKPFNESPISFLIYAQKPNSVLARIQLNLFFSPYDPESFSCEGQDYGYYADVASGCEVTILTFVESDVDQSPSPDLPHLPAHPRQRGHRDQHRQVELLLRQRNHLRPAGSRLQLPRRRLPVRGVAQPLWLRRVRGGAGGLLRHSLWQRLKM